jgi:hypothetical protein
MPWPLDKKFKIAANREILAFITRTNPSAHSDISSALTDATESLPDVRQYCPDKHAYAYWALHTGDCRIFALAFGMSGLAYRVPFATISVATADGTGRRSEIGADWIEITPWPTGMTSEAAASNLRRWCKIAHDYVARL